MGCVVFLFCFLYQESKCIHMSIINEYSKEATLYMLKHLSHTLTFPVFFSLFQRNWEVKLLKMPACVKLRLCSRKKYIRPSRSWAENISFLLATLFWFKKKRRKVVLLSDSNMWFTFCASKKFFYLSWPAAIIFFSRFTCTLISRHRLSLLIRSEALSCWSSISLSVCSLDELSDKVSLIEGHQKY